MKKFLVILALLTAPLLFSQESDKNNVITVEVGVADANPPLYLDATGNPETIALMRNTLTRCDWFTLISKKEGAKYIVQFDATNSEGICRLYDNTGKFLGGWKGTSANASRQSIFFFVDKVIETAMRNPGLCHSKILFACGDGKKKEIFSCNFDGSEITQMTRNNTFSTEPSWMPGKELFVYTYYTASAMNIASFNFVQRTHRRICRYPGLNSSPSVSPDNKWLAVCLSQNGKVDLYLRRLEGDSLIALTQDTHVESSPTWSGDQKQICFVSDKSGRPRLYIVDVATKAIRSLRPMLYELKKDGSKGNMLGEYGVQLVGPSWSSVSNKIAYSVLTGGRYAIAVVDMSKDHNSAVVISNMPGDWEDPCWAPDGRHLVCSRSVGGKRSLWQIDSIYGTAIQITSAKNADFSLPSWSSWRK